MVFVMTPSLYPPSSTHLSLSFAPPQPLLLSCWENSTRLACHCDLIPCSVKVINSPGLARVANSFHIYESLRVADFQDIRAEGKGGGGFAPSCSSNVTGGDIINVPCYCIIPVMSQLMTVFHTVEQCLDLTILCEHMVSSGEEIFFPSWVALDLHLEMSCYCSRTASPGVARWFRISLLGMPRR